MRAIVIKRYGGPEVLAIEERPDPKPEPGHVVIEVKAFGINHAEIHMRRGEWPEIAEISGIECAGLVHADPTGRFRAGEKVVAFMGGMGRSIGGSYAEFTRVPIGNVAAVETELAWEDIAAIPESYATAWVCLNRNLALGAGQTLVVRGATSALGQAAVNIAVHVGARVVATTRNPKRATTLQALGAHEILIDGSGLSTRVRERRPQGVDAVLELVGNSTVLDSLRMVRRDGRLCEAGWLGGLAPIVDFNPMLQLPSGVHFSLFGSFMFGTADYPVADVPMQEVIDQVAAGRYQAKPVKVFRFEEVADAHAMMESGQANGKIVIRL